MFFLETIFLDEVKIPTTTFKRNKINSIELKMSNSFSITI